MDEHSKNSKFLNTLKLEWALFWASLSDDEGDTEKLDPSELEDFSKEKIESYLKALSVERNQLNKKLESIKKEIELNQTKVESLRLVGGDLSDIEEKISHLTDEGYLLSENLKRLDEKLRKAHEFENNLSEI